MEGMIAEWVEYGISNGWVRVHRVGTPLEPQVIAIIKIDARCQIKKCKPC